MILFVKYLEYQTGRTGFILLRKYTVNKGMKQCIIQLQIVIRAINEGDGEGAKEGTLDSITGKVLLKEVSFG